MAVVLTDVSGRTLGDELGQLMTVECDTAVHLNRHSKGSMFIQVCTNNVICTLFWREGGEGVLRIALQLAL